MVGNRALSSKSTSSRVGVRQLICQVNNSYAHQVYQTGDHIDTRGPWHVMSWNSQGKEHGGHHLLNRTLTFGQFWGNTWYHTRVGYLLTGTVQFPQTLAEEMVVDGWCLLVLASPPGLLLQVYLHCLGGSLGLWPPFVISWWKCSSGMSPMRSYCSCIPSGWALLNWMV